MRRLVLLLFVAVAPGCLTPADKKQWGEAMDDLHGHNMKMQGEKATPYENKDRIIR